MPMIPMEQKCISLVWLLGVLLWTLNEYALQFRYEFLPIFHGRSDNIFPHFIILIRKKIL